jgi:RNA polymerase sigma-70 factor (ECF subfamily)
MARDDQTEMGGDSPRLPTTHWSELAKLGAPVTTEHRAALAVLLQRYWKPVYCYLRRRGFNNEDAKDLVQEFFTSALEKELFQRADPTRGRFRAFLLACLDRFVANVQRAKRAKRRRPAKGIVSIQQLSEEMEIPFEPSEDETPDKIFDRSWASELVLRVLRQLQKECHTTGKQAHYLVFHRRLIAPVLEGAEPPAMAELAEELGVTPKQAANLLLTARRAYQRLLREEIKLYAASEDEVEFEVQDVFTYLAV